MLDNATYTDTVPEDECILRSDLHAAVAHEAATKMRRVTNWLLRLPVSVHSGGRKRSQHPLTR